jgi:hypothetical protein
VNGVELLKENTHSSQGHDILPFAEVVPVEIYSSSLLPQVELRFVIIAIKGARGNLQG